MFYRELYQSTVSPLEFELDDGPAIEELLQAYPVPMKVQDLSHSSEEVEDKVSIAHALYKEGFLLIMDDATRAMRKSDIHEEDDYNSFDDDPF
jgi:ABC-type sugar transport system ATPase subunit